MQTAPTWAGLKFPVFVSLLRQKCSIMELNEKILDIALGEYGTIETSGPENNPDVMKYFHETGRTWVDADSTPWCDAFADWVVQKAGGQITPGLLARAWMDAGVPTDRKSVV